MLIVRILNTPGSLSQIIESWNRYKLYQLQINNWHKVTREIQTNVVPHTSKSVSRKTLSLTLDDNDTIRNPGNRRTWHSNIFPPQNMDTSFPTNNKHSMTASQFECFRSIFVFSRFILWSKHWNCIKPYAIFANGSWLANINAQQQSNKLNVSGINFAHKEKRTEVNIFTLACNVRFNFISLSRNTITVATGYGNCSRLFGKLMANSDIKPKR